MIEDSLISEHRLVIREYADEFGTRITLSIEGDSEGMPDDAEITLGYGIAATMFHLYSDGTVVGAMKEFLGYVPENIRIVLE